jgi:hypothetical protein
VGGDRRESWRNTPFHRDGSHPTLSPDALENEGSWYGQLRPTECEVMRARVPHEQMGSDLGSAPKKEASQCDAVDSA